MIKFNYITESIVWLTTAGLAGVVSNIGEEGFSQVLETYGPWGLIAAAAGILLRLVIQDIRNDQKELKKNQEEILKKLHELEDELPDQILKEI